MLRNTLTLPTDDPNLAAQQLRTAISDLSVVPMLVLGTGAEVEQIVDWADQLCDKTDFGTGNLRHVIWIRQPDVEPVHGVLHNEIQKAAETFGQGNPPLVLVLNFHTAVKAVLREGDVIDPLELELAFAAGEGT
jgi:hypothetical protein